MRSRRIGTLTLGILLIVLGVLYLLMNCFNLPIWKGLLDFWPVIFISLGIEVLLLNYIALKKNISLRFDFISLMLIVIMFFFTFGTFIVSKAASNGIYTNTPIYFSF